MFRRVFAVLFSLGAIAAAPSLAAREIHVAVTGDDSNPGDAASPYETIQMAADVAQPGDVITVHAGVYREQVDPRRGGESGDQRITYQAAPGEVVEIAGSEVFNDWLIHKGDVWKADVPNWFFGDFNPYGDEIHGDWFLPKGRSHHTGAVYWNGEALPEAASEYDMLNPKSGNGWVARVTQARTTIFARFGGKNPNLENVEVNVRRAVFYPSRTNINYITVRGFILRDAATPWAPPTAEQVGLIGTHWSRGWIIESNTISYSKCCGVALGKYGDEWDNRSESAAGYVATIQRAESNGWNKATVGGHIVRQNEISHCGQAGIVGSLGAAFSVIEGNTIHDIHVHQLFSGMEMAGIKFHGGIDVQVTNNHIFHCSGGLWLDWMGQGARISRNLFNDNGAYDLFLEVDHGPILIDNNIFLSGRTLESRSRGLALVQNLIGGSIVASAYDARSTPFLKPHSTELAGFHDNPRGDDRYYNNLILQHGDLSQYDSTPGAVAMAGNVFLKGAKPSKLETTPVLSADFDPALKLTKESDGLYLEMKYDPAWLHDAHRKLVTTELLGKATIPDEAFEQPDRTPISINTDYFGKPRDESNPTPGPFENPDDGAVRLKVR